MRLTLQQKPARVKAYVMASYLPGITTPGLRRRDLRDARNILVDSPCLDVLNLDGSLRSWDNEPVPVFDQHACVDPAGAVVLDRGVVRDSDLHVAASRDTLGCDDLLDLGSKRALVLLERCFGVAESPHHLAIVSTFLTGPLLPALRLLLCHQCQHLSRMPND